MSRGACELGASDGGALGSGPGTSGTAGTCAVGGETGSGSAFRALALGTDVVVDPLGDRTHAGV